MCTSSKHKPGLHRGQRLESGYRRWKFLGVKLCLLKDELKHQGQEAQAGAQRRQVHPMNFPDGNSGIRTLCGKVNVSSRSWIFSFLLTSDTSQMICPDLASPLAEPGWRRLGQGGQYCQDLRAPRNPSVFLPVRVSPGCLRRRPCLALTPTGPTAALCPSPASRQEGLKVLSPVP